MVCRLYELPHETCRTELGLVLCVKSLFEATLMMIIPVLLWLVGCPYINDNGALVDHCEVARAREGCG